MLMCKASSASGCLHLIFDWPKRVTCLKTVSRVGKNTLSLNGRNCKEYEAKLLLPHIDGGDNSLQVHGLRAGPSSQSYYTWTTTLIS